MMPSIPEEIIINAIRKTATPEEQAILNKWLKEDKANVEYYYQLDEIWQSRNEISEDMMQEGWERLSVHILSRPHRQTVHPKKNRSLNWLQYAAAILIGAVISSAIWIYISHMEDDYTQHMLVQHVIYNHSGIQPVLLPDQSEVWINENTRLSYPEEFIDGRRLVSLEGKAYFDIRKNAEKPFIVQIGKAEIEVTGTEFFVESFLENESYVTLITGSVNLNYKDINGKERVMALVPGQQAALNPLNGEINMVDIDTEYLVAWKDGTYRFTEEPLEKVSKLLAAHFDLDFQLVGSLKSKKFTGRVTPEETIQDVLEAISNSSPLKYEITGNTVKISE